ncbi:CsbD family protein [Periweissella ghanensis]|uniref:CsbD-like domain-containing protein n=1 Tax=Periweissella ghanensis TaxID=467997 RepID=A0ABM8ZA22_9LACO|nr:CsbD family protein [Periweissella ghanensis]MCM0600586.1 CsbD family protein [Periweissella ghanensis]CAH0418331.1 hypothetical protein WGH24286_00749 [Periweissella ghanensis]
MSFEENLKNTKDQVTGKVKEVAGELTDNQKLEAEGKTEGLFGKAKEALVDAKDKAAEKLSDVSEAVAEKFNDTVDDLREKKAEHDESEDK